MTTWIEIRFDFNEQRANLSKKFNYINEKLLDEKVNVESEDRIF
jgi:hypothetical protein